MAKQKKEQSAEAKAKRKTEQAAKFTSVANKRVPKAIKAITLIGNLANRRTYVYTAEQANKIIAALDESVKALRGKFAGEVETVATFKL